MDNNLAEKQSVAPSRELEILAASQILARDGRDAQKGSHVAADGLLHTAEWLKDSGLLKEVLGDMEQGGFAKVKKGKNGDPAELTFDQDLPGYPKTVISVDLNKMEINHKSKEQVKKEALAERKDFVDALASVKNRPLPEGETKALSPLESKILQKLEESLSNGDLASLTRAFQSNSKSNGLWTRMEKEINADFNSPPAVRYGKAPDGSPYLAIIGEGDNPSDNFQAIVIKATGNPQVHSLDDNGDIDFAKKSNAKAEQVMEKQQTFRLPRLEEKMSDYRCDFDEHERSDTKKFGPVSVKVIVEKYNTYTEHLCGSEFQD